MTEHHNEDDDLAPTKTTGYKPGEKRTGPGEVPRRVIFEYTALEVKGRTDAMVDLSIPSTNKNQRLLIKPRIYPSLLMEMLSIA
ncbi:hypothetical protein EDC94DRAFT_658471 [Helicostylum pulchrum]|nr:hypothetical protein EDC94DRAFT_658471 [Helicostylum pulchrum]